ncbi:MAG TPA: hypothetical protein VGJ31_13030 [Dongiaceae bacterium]
MLGHDLHFSGSSTLLEAIAIEQEGTAGYAEGQFMALPRDELRIVDRIEFRRDVIERPEDMFRYMNGLVAEKRGFMMLLQALGLIRCVAHEYQAVEWIVAAMGDRECMRSPGNAIALDGPCG